MGRDQGLELPEAVKPKAVKPKAVKPGPVWQAYVPVEQAAFVRALEIGNVNFISVRSGHRMIPVDKRIPPIMVDQAFIDQFAISPGETGYLVNLDPDAEQVWINKQTFETLFAAAVE